MARNKHKVDVASKFHRALTYEIVLSERTESRLAAPHTLHRSLHGFLRIADGTRFGRSSFSAGRGHPTRANQSGADLWTPQLFHSSSTISLQLRLTIADWCMCHDWESCTLPFYAWWTRRPTNNLVNRYVHGMYGSTVIEPMLQCTGSPSALRRI